MKKILFSFALASSATITAIAQTPTFSELTQVFLREYWQLHPASATYSGLHTYDSELPIPNQENKTKLRANALVWLENLAAVDKSKLSAGQLVDMKLMQNELHSTIWNMDTLRSYEWDPGSYNITGLFAQMLNEPYDDLDKRLINIGARAQKVPEFLAAAKNNIKNPVEVLRLLAAAQIRGGIDGFAKEFEDSLKTTQLPEVEQLKLIAAVTNARAELLNFSKYLEEMKVAKPRSFRLGKDLYEEKFKYEIQSAYTATQMYKMAEDRKVFIHKEMSKIAKELWPKYFANIKKPADELLLISMVIDTVSRSHTTAEGFQAEIQRQIPELVAYVAKNDLLYIDPSKPLVVRPEPAYMAGVAGASISSPGPYELGGNTYYNVGSLNGWTPERAESYLREYNDYTLQILNIHEAIPGHYTQLVYANKSPSLIKSIFGNGAMIEGWAVYGEQMMLESGYGGNKPEMWLMWYKWNLRTVCNFILDYSVHAGNMTEEQAMDLLVRQAFQQQAEASGKWNRVMVSNVQLTSYFTGYTEIIKLREKYKAKMGKDYTLKGFNEKFLSYGSAPVKYIAELMLNEKK